MPKNQLFKCITRFFAIAFLFATELYAVDAKKDSHVVVLKQDTKFNFEETLIEGDKKLPTGFYLRGRSTQSMEQMVKLRADFLKQLRASKASVKAMTK